MEEGTWRFGKVAAGEDVVKADPLNGPGGEYSARYPDVHQIIPDAAREPEFEICVSARYLGEAIAAMKGKRGLGFVRLRFFGDTSPLEVYGSLGTVKDSRGHDVDQPGYALIMPVHKAAVAHNWRPTRPVKDATS
jgi:hypothetical protein